MRYLWSWFKANGISPQVNTEPQEKAAEESKEKVQNTEQSAGSTDNQAATKPEKQDAAKPTEEKKPGIDEAIKSAGGKWLE